MKPSAVWSTRSRTTKHYWVGQLRNRLLLDESTVGLCTEQLVLQLIAQDQCVRHQRKMSTSSTKVETFEIEFDREPAVYREGDNITGKVNVTLNEEIKLRSECYFALPCFSQISAGRWDLDKLWSSAMYVISVQLYLDCPRTWHCAIKGTFSAAKEIVADEKASNNGGDSSNYQI